MPRQSAQVVGGGAALTNALAVATWWLTAGALIAVAVVLTARLRRSTASGAVRRSRS